SSSHCLALHLRSFPTRRSSDLRPALRAVGRRRQGADRRRRPRRSGAGCPVGAALSRRQRRSYNGGMRLLLQQRPGGPEAPRFVQLMLERDLLGGWTLVRETGQVGGRSSVRREQYLDQREAFKALEHARDLQLKKGFQLMFAQGVDAPK